MKIARGEHLGVYEERKIPFQDFCKQYLAFSKANKAPSTYAGRDKISVSHLKSFSQGRYLFDISPQKVENYKPAGLKKAGPATLNRELSCLKHMYTK